MLSEIKVPRQIAEKQRKKLKETADKAKQMREAETKKRVDAEAAKMEQQERELKNRELAIQARYEELDRRERETEALRLAAKQQEKGNTASGNATPSTQQGYLGQHSALSMAEIEFQQKVEEFERREREFFAAQQNVLNHTKPSNVAQQKLHTSYQQQNYAQPQHYAANQQSPYYAAPPPQSQLPMFHSPQFQHHMLYPSPVADPNYMTRQPYFGAPSLPPAMQQVEIQSLLL